MSVQVVISWIFFVLAILFSIAAPLSLVAFRWREGFWGNALCCFNFGFASLFALNYFEAFAAILAQYVWVGGLFFYDFVAFWLIFAFFHFILNFSTNRLSKIKVHFPPLIEKTGNGFSLAGIVGTFAAAAFFSLPCAPLPPKEGGVEAEAQRSEWLGYRARLLSHGSLAPFSGNREWTASEDYVSLQMEKRWLIDKTVRDSNTFLHDGVVPPVNAKLTGN